MSTLSALHGTGAVIYSKYIARLPVPEASSDLAQQVIIVTGSNTGLGLEASLHLARLGVGKLVMAVRTPSKGEAAREQILKATGRPGESIEVWPIDMDNFDSVKAFAARAAAELPRLDGVLANAGIMMTKFEKTEGYEKTLTVNVVGTFLLYLLLLPKMRASGQQTGNVCRFVVPNSALHYSAPLAELQQPAAGKEGHGSSGGGRILERLSDPARADMAGRYHMSKLLVLYAVRELAARSKAAQRDPVVLNTPNPSFCVSGLASELQSSAGFRAFEKLMARSTEQGSRTLVHGLLAGPESNGAYLNNCQVQSPACHVTNQWGQQFQKAFVDELVEELEKIQPGVSSAI